MAEVGSKSKSRERSWALAVIYVLAMAVIFDVPARLGWGPKPSVQDVIGLSTFFVLWGIGGLESEVRDLRERIGPPRE